MSSMLPYSGAEVGESAERRRTGAAGREGERTGATLGDLAAAVAHMRELAHEQGSERTGTLGALAEAAAAAVPVEVGCGRGGGRGGRGGRGGAHAGAGAGCGGRAAGAAEAAEAGQQIVGGQAFSSHLGGAPAGSVRHRKGCRGGTVTHTHKTHTSTSSKVSIYWLYNLNVLGH